jgi:O-antigen/teichoic acid export membrane protein
MFSIIEGCNQVSSVYAFRLFQGILNSLLIIACILLGLGLYALAVAGISRFLCGIGFLLWRHRHFLKQLLRVKVCTPFKWQTEVWPFQWRIAISWFSRYFVFSLFRPVMFFFHGPQVAGQMGMTWSLVAMVETVAYTWIHVRAPLFGMLIARQQFLELDCLFGRLLSLALAIAFAGALGLFVLVFFLNSRDFALSERLLPLLPTTLFLIQRIINVAISAMAIYLRAHKSEPLMTISLVGALSVGASSLVLGSLFGPTGAAFGFLAITVLWSLPACYYVFSSKRRLWHAS